MSDLKSLTNLVHSQAICYYLFENQISLHFSAPHPRPTMKPRTNCRPSAPSCQDRRGSLYVCTMSPPPLSPLSLCLFLPLSVTSQCFCLPLRFRLRFYALFLETVLEEWPPLAFWMGACRNFISSWACVSWSGFYGAIAAISTHNTLGIRISQT
jgi:hypothetical protein